MVKSFIFLSEYVKIMDMKLNDIKEAKKEIAQIITNLNSSTACFTGHRIQKLPWGNNEDDERCVKVKAVLRTEIEKAINRGYMTFICGMALGFDTYCAEIVIELKQRYKNIKLIGAIPCRNQDIKWSKNDRRRYRKLIKQLDGVRCVYNEYIGAECMIERNRYMVNSSSLMIALYDDKTGGTKSTIDYAHKKGLEIVIIKP